MSRKRVITLLTAVSLAIGCSEAPVAPNSANTDDAPAHSLLSPQVRLINTDGLYSPNTADLQ